MCRKKEDYKRSRHRHVRTIMRTVKCGRMGQRSVFVGVVPIVIYLPISISYDFFVDPMQCESNPGYMLQNCKLSCSVCHDPEYVEKACFKESLPSVVRSLISCLCHFD